ncbi:MAG TPA: DUF1360 domain-containing protein [Micromonosporaceae bacterium]|nr:DUF1360 domain-containing protein [Micromonosporaceae bacterium]
MTDDAGYSPHEHRPLRGYLTLMSVYAGGTLGAAALARRTGRTLPERLDATDIATLAVATHKLSRIISKDSVTSPLRAPFTRYEEPAGEAELNESPRGSGVRHSLGELLTCPFCMAVWVATGFAGGLVFAPRLTRLVAGAAAAVAGADFLHIGYTIAKQSVHRD